MCFIEVEFVGPGIDQKTSCDETECRCHQSKKTSPEEDLVMRGGLWDGHGRRRRLCNSGHTSGLPSRTNGFERGKFSNLARVCDREACVNGPVAGFRQKSRCSKRGQDP